MDVAKLIYSAGQGLKGLYTLGRFTAIFFTRETTFETSHLLYYTQDGHTFLEIKFPDFSPKFPSSVEFSLI